MFFFLTISLFVLQPIKNGYIIKYTQKKERKKKIIIVKKKKGNKKLNKTKISSYSIHTPPAVTLIMRSIYNQQNPCSIITETSGST